MSSKKIESLVDTNRHVLFCKKANNRQQLGNATKASRTHAAHKDYGVDLRCSQQLLGAHHRYTDVSILVLVRKVRFAFYFRFKCCECGIVRNRVFNARKYYNIINWNAFDHALHCICACVCLLQI